MPDPSITEALAEAAALAPPTNGVRLSACSAAKASSKERDLK